MAASQALGEAAEEEGRGIHAASWRVRVTASHRRTGGRRRALDLRRGGAWGGRLGAKSELGGLAVMLSGRGVSAVLDKTHRPGK